MKLFIVTTDVSIFLQLIIIINALFIFIFIIFITINTIIVMLVFTLEFFKCPSCLCQFTRPFFLKDYNRNKVFFMLSLQLYLIYDLFDIIFNFNYTIILEKLLKFLFLGTIFCYDTHFYLLTCLPTSSTTESSPLITFEAYVSTWHVEHPSKGTCQKFYQNTFLGFALGNYTADSLLKYDQTLP